MINAAMTMWTSLVDTVGKPVVLAWDRLFDNFSAAVLFAGDHEHPGWSPARFEPCVRAAANVRAVSAMVLDYDGTENIDTATERWGRHYGFLHTTRKHTPDVHRFRVILPFGREVTPQEYGEIWRRIFAQADGKPDPAPKDPSRFWYTPGTPNRQHFQTRRLTGQIMDPDDLLRDPDPRAPSAVAPSRSGAEPGSRERRASAYLARMPESIAGQGGDHALWKAALAMVQGFDLNEEAAFRLLWLEFNPRCQPPWTEKVIEHKVRDAARQPRVPNGYILDENRDWQAGRRGTPARTATSAPTNDPAEEWDRGGADGPAPAVAAQQPAANGHGGGTAVQRHGVRSLAEMLNGVYLRASAQQPERGAPSGNEQLDRVIAGFRRGRITVLGASTSWGKSSFAVMTADVGMRQGKRILLVSGEDSQDAYGQRFMARRASVNAIALRDCELKPTDLGRMAAALSEAEQDPFFLEGIGKPAEYLAAAVGAICAECNIDLVIVDYLQAFSCAKHCQDRRNEVTHIARLFADAIKGANAAGLILSQLKRLEDNQRPTMHDLKESGDVENMAEHVLIGYRHLARGLEAGMARRYVIVEKNKDGPPLAEPIEMRFDEVTASFREQRGEP